MNVATVDLKQMYRELLDYYSPRPVPGESQAKLWRDEMDCFDLGDVREMISEVKRQYQHMPTINQCVAMCRSIADSKARHRHLEEKKKDRFTDFWNEDELKMSHGKKVLQNISQFLAGKKTRREFVETAEVLMKGVDLRDYYAKHGFDLDSKPKGGLISA